MIKRLTLGALLIWMTVMLVEQGLVRPYLHDLVVAKFDAAYGAELTSASQVRTQYEVHNVGPALQANCDELAGCFDWNNYTNVVMLFASAPVGNGSVRVLKECDKGACAYVSRFGAYIRQASEEEMELLGPYDSEEECTYTFLYLYELRLCSSTIFNDAVAETTYLAASLSKPISYGFLMFDQKLLREHGATINHVTGDVRY